MPAVGALAAIDLVVVALVAAILVFALISLYRPFLTGALGSLPLVGGWIQSNIETLLLRAAVAATLWAQAAVSPLTDAIDRVWAERHAFGLATVQTIQLGYNVTAILESQLRWVAQQLLPAEIRASLALALAYANQLAQQLEQAIVAALASAVAYTTQVAQQLEQLDRDLYASAVQVAVSEAEAVDAHVRLALAEAVTHTDQAVGQVEALATGLYAQSLAYSQEVGRDLLVALDADQAWTRDAVRQAEVEGQAAAAAAGAAALAGAGALVTAVAARVTAIEDSPCQRFCSPLGDAGQLLQGIQDAGILAIILGLVVQAEQDPAGLARELHDGLVEPVQGILGAIGYRGKLP